MSRFYEIELDIIPGTNEEEIIEKLEEQGIIIKDVWEDISLAGAQQEDCITISGLTTLVSGESEEEAHLRICKALSNQKIATRWRYGEIERPWDEEFYNEN